MQFSKTESPPFVNEGRGWENIDAVNFCAFAELSISNMKETDTQIVFLQIPPRTPFGNCKAETNKAFKGISMLWRDET